MGFKNKKNRVHPSGNKKKQQRKEKKKRRVAGLVQKMMTFSCCTVDGSQSGNVVSPETYIRCDGYAQPKTAAPEQTPPESRKGSPLMKKASSRSCRISPTQADKPMSPAASPTTCKDEDLAKHPAPRDKPVAGEDQPAPKQEVATSAYSVPILSISKEACDRVLTAGKSVSSHEYFDTVEPVEKVVSSKTSEPVQTPENESSDEYVTASEDEHPDEKSEEAVKVSVEEHNCSDEIADASEKQAHSDDEQQQLQKEQQPVAGERESVPEETCQNREKGKEHDYNNYFPPIPTSTCGLRGWTFPRGVTQFLIRPFPPHSLKEHVPIMSCGIIHTLLAVSFYANSLQGGEVFEGSKLEESVEWMIRSVIKNGNTAHLERYPHNRFLTAIESFKVVREKSKMGLLEWDMESLLAPLKAIGIDLQNEDQPTGLPMDIVNPASDDSSLAHHVSQLDVSNGDALLYTFNSNFMSFVPTEDGRILLMDEHPHQELNAGAVILVCPKTREHVQDMLDKYHKEHFGSSFSLGQGTKFTFKKY